MCHLQARGSAMTAILCYLNSSIFFQIPVRDGYDMGMCVGYVSDTRTQFKHLDPQNFIIFEEK